jgi:hypothetical protein
VQSTVAPSNAINPAFSTRRLVEKRFWSIEGKPRYSKLSCKILQILRKNSRQFYAWMINQSDAGEPAAVAGFSQSRTPRQAMPTQQTTARDVSKLKFIGSTYCIYYRSKAEFYIDDTDASGFRRLVVIYDLGGYGGRPDFEAGIPSDWSEKKLQNDLILHTTRGGLYPGWEMPARIFKSDMLFEWWKVDTPAE